MYRDYFGLKELPFSIAPDPRYLYMSERHKEALAHLLYGVSGQGGFVVLTGEVGTGKTTICRCFLQQVPDNTDVAFIVNPKLSARELLANICDEFGIEHPIGASIKVYNDLISHYLLNAHSSGRHTVLVIDEAQNLRIDVLEQLRLLTNLETSEKKLLQIILLGQPELHDMLSRQELRQLSQRITARYHLKSLNKEEVTAYIRYRLAVAGQKQDLFQTAAIKTIYRKSGGIPRLINLVCDRALLGAYSENSTTVSSKHIKQAFQEIGDNKKRGLTSVVPRWVLMGISMGLVFGLVLVVIIASFSFIKATSKTEHPQLAGTKESNDSANERELSDKVGSEPLTSGEPPNAQNTEAKKTIVDPKKRFGSQYISSLKYTAPPFNSKLSAYESILQKWGIRYNDQNNSLVCEFAETQGLGCLHKQGNWRSLLQINRPVVMKLSNHKGQEFYIGLLEVDDEYAKVTIGKKTAWTTKDAIDQQWLGDYSVLWRLPPYKSRVIKPGTENDPAKWLNNQISTVKAQGINGNGGRLQSDNQLSLEESVQWFQHSVGLTPDGIAGALTLIHLNNYISPGTPKLLGDPKAQELPQS